MPVTYTIRSVPWTDRSGDSHNELSMQMVASDLGLPINTALDFIGIGEVIGATSGIGDGNTVVLPSDFAGQSLSFTLTNGQLGTLSTFSNIQSQKNLSVLGNGTGRIETPSWASPSKTIVQPTTLNPEIIQIEVLDNSNFGNAARSGTIYLYGSNQNVAQATTTINQSGNPASLGTTPTSLSYLYSETSKTITLSPTANISPITVSTTDSHLTATKSGNTITVTRTVDYVTSVRNINVLITAYNSADASQSFIDTVTTTIDAYTNTTITGTGIVSNTWAPSPVGVSQVLSGAGISGNTGTVSIELDSNDQANWISVASNTVTVGAGNVTCTILANNTNSSRTGLIKCTDTISSVVQTVTVTQQPAPLSSFTVTPISLTWNWDDTTTKQVAVNLTANPGYNTHVKTDESFTTNSANFQHSFTNSSFVGIGTDIESTASGNKILYIKPTSQNTSITTNRTWTTTSAIYYRVGSKDYLSTYNSNIQLNQLKKPVSMFWKFANSSGTGTSSTYPLGPNYTQADFYLFSSHNDVAIDLDIIFYGGFVPVGYSFGGFGGSALSLPAYDLDITWQNNGQTNYLTYPYVRPFYLHWTGSSSGCSSTGEETIRLAINGSTHNTSGTGTSWIEFNEGSADENGKIWVCSPY